MKSPEIMAFIREVKTGVFNQENLIQFHKALFDHGYSLPNMIEKISYPIVYCDCCGVINFSHDTSTAYNGFYWVCKRCVESFTFCAPCNTLVLTDDLTSPTHRHSRFDGGGTVFVPPQPKVAAFNADIMRLEGRKASFFKTKEETASYIMRCKNFARDPERVFRYFGVELEVEKVPGAPPDLNDRTYDVLGSNFVLLKHDGSLSQHGRGGFEIVSMPATIKYHKGGTWKKFFDTLGPFFKREPGTTGLHIHVGTSTVPRIVQNKMLLFVNSRANREFIFSMGNRNLSKANPNGRVYAGVRDWQPGDIMRIMQHGPSCAWNAKNRSSGNRYKLNRNGQIAVDDIGNPIILSIKEVFPIVRPTCQCPQGHYNIEHYEAFNLRTHRGTVEFRIFKGIISELFLYAALEFVDGLADFCEVTPFSQLHYKNFVNWVTLRRGKLYPNLHQLLVNQLWIDPPKTTPKSEAVRNRAFGLYA